VVFNREVLSKDADGGKGQGTGGQELEDLWEAPAGSSRFDAVAGGILGETKGLSTVGEERAVALSGVECRAAIERGQMGDQLGRRLTLLASEHFQASEEVVIRQGGGDDEDVGVHSSGVSRRFSRTGRGPGMPQGDVARSKLRARGLRPGND
jgi:hypothetical protein